MPPRSGSGFPWVIVGVVGCLGLLVVVGVISAVMVPALTAARTASRAVDCRNDMKQIGVYVELYESKFRDYPNQLRDLWRPDLATNPNIFICPVNGKPLKSPKSTGMKWEEFSSLVGIEYVKPPSPDSPWMVEGRDTSHLLVAWESKAHPDGRRTVLYLHARVETVDDATFQAAMKARREWR